MNPEPEEIPVPFYLHEMKRGEFMTAEQFRWQLFNGVDTKEFDGTRLYEMPQSIGGISGETIRFENDRFQGSSAVEGRIPEAVLCAEPHREDTGGIQFKFST